MDRPETRYTKTADGVHIAYQVIGEGPSDLVFVMNWVSNIDAMWEEPNLARFLTRLASFSRLILFDKRGVGLSDRAPDDRLPSLEVRMDDVRSVMDAAASERAIVFGVSDVGPMADSAPADRQPPCRDSSARLVSTRRRVGGPARADVSR